MLILAPTFDKDTSVCCCKDLHQCVPVAPHLFWKRVKLNWRKEMIEITSSYWLTWKEEGLRTYTAYTASWQGAIEMLGSCHVARLYTQLMVLSLKTATCSLPRLSAESCKNLCLYDHLIWHTGLHGGQDYHVVWILHEEKLSTAQHDGKVKQDLT